MNKPKPLILCLIQKHRTIFKSQAGPQTITEFTHYFFLMSSYIGCLPKLKSHTIESSSSSSGEPLWALNMK